MERKAVFGVALTLLFMSMLTGILPIFRVQAVEIPGPIYIHADGSIDPPTAPILRTGDLYTLTDNIIITNEAVGIVLQERSGITLDGTGYTLQAEKTISIGIYIRNIGNVTIKNTNINRFWSGIFLDSSDYNSISGNTIANSYVYGILLQSSRYNSISGNIITDSYGHGISLGHTNNTSPSNYNTIFGNIITNSHGAGLDINPSSYTTIRGNAINGNNVGIFLSSASEYNSVSDNVIANTNTVGVDVGGNSNNISENKITGSRDGFWVSSSNNSISGNTISNNQYGIRVYGSNSIYHNNFIDNTNQAYSYKSKSIWDNGTLSGGNFWSSYTGSDIDGDGIGDTPYVIDVNNTDRSPLIVPAVWNYSTPIPIALGGTANWVSLSSNSIISAVKFYQTQKQISFKVTGTDGTLGFCQVTIPNTLLSRPYNISVDNSPPLTLTETSNGTHTILYFTYSQGIKTVEIRGTGVGVTPQLPLVTILLLLTILIILTAVAAVLVKKKITKKSKTDIMG